VHPLRHGYTNDTHGDGSVVIKRYTGPGAETRRSTERAMLGRLAGGAVPVPALLADPPGALHLAHVRGRHGQDLIDAGHAVPVLRSCGETLRRLQSVDAAAPGAVLVHGDFGPNNMLFDPDTFAVTAVLDWEWSRPGHPIEDVAWCEWIVRTHHPAAAGALDHFFAGYGRRPPWADRQAAAAARCRELLALFAPGTPGARQWRQRLNTTLAWTE
jgi:Ser/Thr protein kinase RdoA (MazF antagonist)